MFDDEEDAPQTRMHARQSLVDIVARVDLPQNPYLIAVRGKESVGKMFRVRGEMVIGRALGVDIQLPEDGVSRRHARVTPLGDGTVRVDDLGSSNGTLFNGERVQSQVLRDGERVQLGDAALALLHIDEIDENLQERLHEHAARDPVTGQYNRKHFLGVLAREMAYAQRYDAPLVLLLFGVDRFRRVVDAHGRGPGDMVLRRIARMVDETVQAEDKTLARYGESEFALLLPDTSPQDGVAGAEWLRRSVEALNLTAGGQKLSLTVSVGAVRYDPAHHGSVETVLESAERALYAARVAGANRVEAEWGASP